MVTTSYDLVLGKFVNEDPINSKIIAGPKNFTSMGNTVRAAGICYVNGAFSHIEMAKYPSIFNANTF